MFIYNYFTSSSDVNHYNIVNSDNSSFSENYQKDYQNHENNDIYFFCEKNYQKIYQNHVKNNIYFSCEKNYQKDYQNQLCIYL